MIANELTREKFMAMIENVTKRWEEECPQRTIYMHPREVYKAWMMGQCRWAFRQWIRLLRYSTWAEWWSDRPWRYGRL